MAMKKVLLLQDIWYDIQRSFLEYSLLFCVILSCFSVIYFTHLNRVTTSKIDDLLTQRDKLESEWRNLVLEQNSLAEHSAVEANAIKNLEMIRPDAKSEIMIKLP